MFLPLQNASDIRVAGGYYWAYFLLASRLYNPRLPLLAIVNKYEAVRNTTVVWGALEAAGVQVRHTTHAQDAQA